MTEAEIWVLIIGGQVILWAFLGCVYVSFDRALRVTDDLRSISFATDRVIADLTRDREERRREIRTIEQHLDRLERHLHTASASAVDRHEVASLARAELRDLVRSDLAGRSLVRELLEERSRAREAGRSVETGPPEHPEGPGADDSQDQRLA